jgi:uncharacterized membrane protein
LAGILFSLVALFVPEAPMFVVFPRICIGSLLASVIVTMSTRPVDAPTLIAFYKTVRPFGFWKPIRARAQISADILGDTSESAWRAVVNTCIGIVAITGYYLFPMYLVGHWHARAAICLGAALLATATLAATWYRHLPQREA